MDEKKQKKQRVDHLLFERGLCSSLKEAQALVYANKIYTHDRKIKKPSEMLEAQSFLGIKSSSSKFVSRGGDKLLGAIKDLDLQHLVKDSLALDVGSSTGGFTDCLLQQGAKHVVALDVGHNQLAWRLQKDPRVTSLEKTHIKDIEEQHRKEYDLIVADISFNSLENLAPHLCSASKKNSFSLILLIKPQFELPRELIPKGGVVTNPEHHAEAVEKTVSCFESLGFSYVGQSKSSVPGRSGNLEYFVHFKKAR